MPMNKIKFPYYPGNIESKKPLGNITLESFISSHKKPKEKIRNIFKQIFEAEKAKDFKLKAELKQKNLFFFNPCVTSDGLGRSYSNITGFTGLLVLDFDHIEKDHAVDLRNWLFDAFTSCVCAYLSPSGHGVKALIKIPKVETVDEFKDYFYGLSTIVQDLEGFDPSGQNPILPLFLSQDTDMLFRSYEQADTMTLRGYKENSFIGVAPEDFDYPDEITEKDKFLVYSKIEKVFQKITTTAHNPLVRISTYVGGLVTAGYLSFEEAEAKIYKEIEANEYMQKSISTYKKTATDMLQRGMTSPIKL